MSRHLAPTRTLLLLSLLLTPAGVRAAAPSTLPATAPAAGQVWWGKPAGGIRVGLACATPVTTSDRPPRFKVVVENVSADPVRLPSVTTYVERPPAEPGEGPAAGAPAGGKPA